MESILFAFALALIELERATIADWVGGFGFMCSLLWIFVCGDRGEVVSFWREKLRSVNKGTEAGQFLEQVWPGQSHLRKIMFKYKVSSCLFNFGIPVVLAIAWIVLISAS